MSEPTPSQGIVGIVGDGRCAQHLLKYLNSLEVDCRQWSRRLEANNEVSWADLEICSTLWVAISDDALIAFCAAKRNSLPRARWFHTSGALEVDGVVGLHPLMALSGTPISHSTYERMALVTTEDEDVIRTHFPFLPNPVYTISLQDRARYHALAVVGGNFSTLLWQETLQGMKTLGLEAEPILLYAEQIAANLKAAPGSALTGPLARGDRQTIDNNIAALEGTPLQSIYRAFAKEYS